MYKKLDWWFILMACVVSTAQAFGQSGEVAGKGYYVVVNAYAESQEEFAEKYFNSIRDEGDEVHYAYVPGKRMYFVYTRLHQDFNTAVQDMLQTRKDARFQEAWVFVSSDPLTPAEQKIVVQPSAPKEKDSPEDFIESSETITASSETGLIDQEAMEDLERKLEPPANIKQIVFVLSNARNNKEVSGDVQIIDTERAKLLGVQNSAEIRAISDPENGTGNLTFICDVFGYRKNQKDVNFQGLDDDEDIQKLDDYYVVFFDLVRYHIGDIATMYNVYFFNDAALMRPESRFEVNSLLDMMRENPDYRIRIHGHTNGNRRGRIITRGESDDFFALHDSNKEGSGSAKMLSKRRAEIIRDYLVSQGVDEDRMEVKAWGGRRMLYDKNSSKARKNVRVEIEILED